MTHSTLLVIMHLLTRISLGAEIDSVPEAVAPPTANDKVIILTERINQLMSRVNELEAEITRLKSTGPTKKVAKAPQPKMDTVQVKPHISDETVLAPVNEDAILTFRKAYALYQTSKYPEAILEWTRFQKDYPDHLLAGSAQFYLGDSYFKQGEYKLASIEFQKVLLTYDRSSHVSDTLERLAICEEKTGNAVQATKHKQMLKGLFAHSPAGLGLTSIVAPSAQPAQAEIKAPSTTARNHIDPPPGETPLTAPMNAPQNKPKEIEPEEEEEPKEIND